LDNFESPQAFTVDDKMIVTNAGPSIDAESFGVAFHHLVDISSLELDVANLVEGAGTGGMIRPETFALYLKSFAEVCYCKRKLPSAVKDLCNVITLGKTTTGIRFVRETNWPSRGSASYLSMQQELTA
jgi:hypothetical protein